MLAAADLGIGSGHSAVVDQGQAQRVRGYRAVFMIGLGYPADRPLRPLTSPNRRPFDEVVHWDRWQHAGIPRTMGPELGQPRWGIHRFAGSSGDYLDAVAFADAATLVVGGRGADLVEVVLDAAGLAGPRLQNRCGRPQGRKTKPPAGAAKVSPSQRTDSSPPRT